MKNVYLIQPNNLLSGSVFLPYSAGTIAAYSFSRQEIKDEYKLCDFVFIKEHPDSAAEKITDPYIAAFSSYMWNVEYNLILAEKIKIKYPGCIIAFGGPSVPDDTKYLDEYPFIDILMHGEGEETFYKILSGVRYEDIKNISYRNGSEIIKNERAVYCRPLDYPSPYTEGYFDYILKDPNNKGVQFDAIIETNRGCPYKCIYCCWAGSNKSFREFPIEKVYGELEYLAENKIAYCVCADSNFGILERDEGIADFIVELKKKYGYPQKFETTAAKNKDDLIFRINQKFDSVGLNRGVSVAVQSTSDSVLKIIGRKNMSEENLASQLEKYRKSGMFTYTDLILGLPGETLESFCNGIFDVIEAGQHYSINVNRCEFLPNTIMYSDDMVTKYKIKTIKSMLCQNHSNTDIDDYMGSRSEIVVETSTMSMAEWREAMRISVFVQGLHCFGLLRYAAIYLRHVRKISYKDFYLGLYKKVSSSYCILKKVLDQVCESIDLFLEGKGNLSYKDERFGKIYWSYEEGFFLACISCLEEIYDCFSDLLTAFDDKRLQDLLCYQKACIVTPGKPCTELEFSYDWVRWFSDIFEIDGSNPEPGNIKVMFSPCEYSDYVKYAKEIVWYGKRNNRMIDQGIIISSDQ